MTRRSLLEACAGAMLAPLAWLLPKREAADREKVARIIKHWSQPNGKEFIGVHLGGTTIQYFEVDRSSGVS